MSLLLLSPFRSTPSKVKSGSAERKMKNGATWMSHGTRMTALAEIAVARVGAARRSLLHVGKRVGHVLDVVGVQLVGRRTDVARRLRQRVRHREVEPVGHAPAHAEDQPVVAALAVADRGAERLRVRPDVQIREAAEAGRRVAIVVAEADVEVASVDVHVVDGQRGRGASAGAPSRCWPAACMAAPASARRPVRRAVSGSGPPRSGSRWSRSDRRRGRACRPPSGCRWCC